MSYRYDSPSPITGQPYVVLFEQSLSSLENLKRKADKESLNPKAQFRVAMRYSQEIGTLAGSEKFKYLKNALYYCELAANQGYAEAQYTLGYWLAKAYNFNKEYKQQKGIHSKCKNIENELVMRIVQLWSYAGDQGHGKSLYMLGLCSQQGFGVEKNQVLGIELIETAANYGCREAINYLNKF